MGCRRQEGSASTTIQPCHPPYYCSVPSILPLARSIVLGRFPSTNVGTREPRRALAYFFAGRPQISFPPTKRTESCPSICPYGWLARRAEGTDETDGLIRWLDRPHNTWTRAGTPSTKVTMGDLFILLRALMSRTVLGQTPNGRSLSVMPWESPSSRN